MSYKTQAPATYANLYELKKEGKLYNFFRGIHFNPTFVTSTDGGETWGNETHFIASELNGTHRPYCHYAGNGTDTIYISFTDGHPRKVGNSLYYAEFRNGKFWKANGTLIKDLAVDGPLRPSEAELIYKWPGTAREKAYSAPDTSVPNSAWTSSMVRDKMDIRTLLIQFTKPTKIIAIASLHGTANSGMTAKLHTAGRRSTAMNRVTLGY